MSLANFRCPDFVNLDILSWTSESSLLVWKNMLYALGNLNCIQIIPYHTDTIKCLIDMLDMFELVIFIFIFSAFFKCLLIEKYLRY
jgi:hypothetical protein